MPTKRENIEKWSNTYQILKYYVDFCFRFYFPTTISGLENIPKGKTVIFAPNHQNALIDALAILSVKTWQPVFLARADIFQKPLISKILTFLKIMPVYRIRDGYGSLHKNDEVFNKTVDVLKNQNGLCLMPEGNHGDKKRLRLPLKKGLARIAFQAEEACKGTLDIHVVPVGLDYTHYSRVGSPLHIRFGPPIRVKPMLSTYKKNPAKAYKELLDLVAQGIKNEIINIEDEQFYDNYTIILDLFAPIFLDKKGVTNNQPNRVEAQRMIVETIDHQKKKRSDDFLVLMACALEFRRLITEMRLNHVIFPIPFNKRMGLISRIILLTASFPIFIYSLINNIFPLSFIRLIGKTIKDPQFVSSVKLAAGLVLFPIFHVIQIVTFALIVKHTYLTLAYTVSLPLGVYLFFKWLKLFRNILDIIREVYCRLYKKASVKRAEELKQQIEKRVWTEIKRKEGVNSLPSYLDE